MQTDPRTRLPIYAAIDAERDRQDAMWGGPAHDDGHNAHQWAGFISDWNFRTVAGGTWLKPDAYRAALVKVAALAVAAIESHDRKQAARL